jgi:hypothetical protein
MGIFSRISGLNGLVEQFPVEEAPKGREFFKQTIQIGSVRFRKCVTVIIDASGLYLKVAPPLSRSSEVLIPWDDIKEVSPTRLYGRQASSLSLGITGEDHLIVYNKLFKLMEPHLS